MEKIVLDQKNCFRSKIIFQIEKVFLEGKKIFRSKKIFQIQKFFLDRQKMFDRKNIFRLKNFLDQKMDIARRLFNDQQPTTCLIDLFGKIYKIDENEKGF